MTAVGEPAQLDARADVRERTRAGDLDGAWAALRPLLLAGDEAWAWSAARNVLRAGAGAGWSPPARREARVAVLCTYTSAGLVDRLELALRALGVAPELYEAPYGQVEQELLDPGSGLAAFGPSHVVVSAVTEDLALPALAAPGEDPVAEHVRRWRGAWDGIAALGARAVQHGFVAPAGSPLGHLAMRLPASRLALVRELNARLAEAAGSDVLLVDCERLAAATGKDAWTDTRLWFATRQPVSGGPLGVLARHTAAVIAGDLGLGARCVVVDLDNTLWGGVVGELGAEGVVVGQGPEGEAFAAFQDHLRALAARGVLLAVASKNDAEAARGPFAEHPGMVLGLDDFAAFVADWRPKSEQIADIADGLGLPLDTFVFADDNPAECAQVALALPEVDAIPLTGPPWSFAGALERSLRFEAPALTAADAGRRHSYRARAQAEELRRGATSLEDFWRSLEMRAQVRALGPEDDLERAAQLVRKTNQFNLTLVRRTPEELRQLLERDGVVARTLALRDRFADHGVIGLAVAAPAGDRPETAVVDTLLLSCRVIGRTAEAHLLWHVARAAGAAGYDRLRGTYVPGPRNALTAEIYPSLGFEPAGERRWELDLAVAGTLQRSWIQDEE